MNEDESQSNTLVKEYSSKEAGSLHSFVDGASITLSIFYGVILVNLAVVFTLSSYIAAVGPLDLADYFLNLLYAVSLCWLFGFGASVKWGCNRADAKDPIKSQQASNRWLKGAVAIFAFTIILKDALELIALTEITNPLCRHKVLYILMPILHIPFIFGQVGFIFFYAKHHIQQCQVFVRFGIMHIIATNISVWIATVAQEANESFQYEMRNHFDKQPERKNASEIESDQEEDYANIFAESSDSLFHGNCTCSTDYCARVIAAEKFLFPFLIEFCLISTCLLYVSWRKVGKKAQPQKSVFKPCLRFYKAYKGPTVGALVLTATVVVITVLGAFDSNVEKKTYLTEYNFLHLYEGFLILCDGANTFACLLGFYLYHSSKKQKKKNASINLDIVLLFVCFLGPLLVGLFSILSLCLGNSESKAPGWWISLVYPIVNIFATILQTVLYFVLVHLWFTMCWKILFILYGLQQIPTILSIIRPTDAPVHDESGFVHRHHLLGSVENREERERNASPLTIETSLTMNKSKNYHEMTSLNQPSLDTEAAFQSAWENSLPSTSTHYSRIERKYDLGTKSVSMFRLAVPGKVRVALRDVIMFLVISNASMWIFLSLDKTVFSILSYQYSYFGHSAWATLTAVTTPLSIFLRMHSSACFFEMWSYA